MADSEGAPSIASPGPEEAAASKRSHIVQEILNTERHVPQLLLLFQSLSVLHRQREHALICTSASHKIKLQAPSCEAQADVASSSFNLIDRGSTVLHQLCSGSSPESAQTHSLPRPSPPPPLNRSPSQSSPTRVHLNNQYAKHLSQNVRLRDKPRAGGCAQAAAAGRRHEPGAA